MGHSIAWEKRGTCISYSGVVTFKDFMSAVLSIHMSPDYGTFKYAIHDMSAATALDFSQVDMSQIVAHELGARYTNPGVMAAVVTVNPDMRKTVEIFSQLTKLHVGLFDTLEQARAWVQ